MPESTPVCAKPTRRHPAGRTGTPAGYSAHRVAKEAACRECMDALNRYVKANRPKYTESRRRYQERNREKSSFRAIERNYNLNRDQYVAMADSQGWSCAICGAEKCGSRGDKLHVDHDHACCPGAKSCGDCVRGLLCARCNAGLGAFCDSPDRLMAAAAYLLKFSNVLMEVNASALE